MKKIILLSLICLIFGQDQEIESVLTGAFGSATINDKVYNQFSLRPEITSGKLGIGLDIYFYFDENGDLYDRNWDFSSSKKSYKTLMDKIYYVRWGQPYDDKYYPLKFYRIFLMMKNPNFYHINLHFHQNKNIYQGLYLIFQM
jgi:hypothetical protein